MDISVYRDYETALADPTIRVHVEITGTPQREKISICCGPGAQKVSWLALTVSQRVSNRLPRGMRRTYEHEFSGIRGGFMMPGEITMSGGKVVDPQLTVKQAFIDGDTCYMRFGASFKGNSTAQSKVVAHGIPSTYISPFNQRAFYPTIASSVNCSGALQQRAALINRQDQVVSRCERLLHKKHLISGEKKATEEEVMAAKFRMLMGGGDLEFDEYADEDLDGDGVSDADGMRLQAARQLFDRFQIKEMKEEEKEEVVAVLSKHLGQLNDVFQYFSAFGANTDTNDLSTMSQNEFFHFLTQSKVFPDLNAVRQQVLDIFELVNALQKNRCAAVERETGDLLVKEEFMECLIRLAHLRFVEGVAHPLTNTKGVLTHPLSGFAEAFDKLMTDYIIPAYSQDSGSVTSELKRGLQEHAVQALFQKSYDHLLLVYKFFANEEEMRAKRLKQPRPANAKKATDIDRPTMNFSEFRNLCSEAGLCLQVTPSPQHTLSPHTLHSPPSVSR
jgi:hypothetical protein